MGWFSSKSKTITGVQSVDIGINKLDDYYESRRQVMFHSSGNSRIAQDGIWHLKHKIRKTYSSRRLAALGMTPDICTITRIEPSNIGNYLEVLDSLIDYSSKQVMINNKIIAPRPTYNTAQVLVDDLGYEAYHSAYYNADVLTTSGSVIEDECENNGSSNTTTTYQIKPNTIDGDIIFDNNIPTATIRIEYTLATITCDESDGTVTEELQAMVHERVVTDDWYDRVGVLNPDDSTEWLYSTIHVENKDISLVNVTDNREVEPMLSIGDYAELDAILPENRTQAQHDDLRIKKKILKMFSMGAETVKNQLANDKVKEMLIGMTVRFDELSDSMQPHLDLVYDAVYRMNGDKVSASRLGLTGTFIPTEASNSEAYTRTYSVSPTPNVTVFGSMSIIIEQSPYTNPGTYTKYKVKYIANETMDTENLADMQESWNEWFNRNNDGLTPPNTSIQCRVDIMEEYATQKDNENVDAILQKIVDEDLLPASSLRNRKRKKYKLITVKNGDDVGVAAMAALSEEDRNSFSFDSLLIKGTYDGTLKYSILKGKTNGDIDAVMITQHNSTLNINTSIFIYNMTMTVEKDNITKTSDFDNSLETFSIPAPTGFMSVSNFYDFCDMYSVFMNGIVLVQQTIKIKWYQTKFFQIVLVIVAVIVAVVITWFTGGFAGGIGAGLVSMTIDMAIGYAISVAIEEFSEATGIDMGYVSALVNLVVGAYTGNSEMIANGIVMLATAYVNSVAEDTKAKTKEVVRRTKEIQKELKELDKKMKYIANSRVNSVKDILARQNITSMLSDSFIGSALNPITEFMINDISEKDKYVVKEIDKLMISPYDTAQSQIDVVEYTAEPPFAMSEIKVFGSPAP